MDRMKISFRHESDDGQMVFHEVQLPEKLDQFGISVVLEQMFKGVSSHFPEGLLFGFAHVVVDRIEEEFPRGWAERKDIDDLFNAALAVINEHHTQRSK